MEATLPVVIRTTCVCPSHLLPAAAERFVMWYLDKSCCGVWVAAHGCDECTDILVLGPRYHVIYFFYLF